MNGSGFKAVLALVATLVFVIALLVAVGWIGDEHSNYRALLAAGLACWAARGVLP